MTPTRIFSVLNPAEHRRRLDATAEAIREGLSQTEAARRLGLTRTGLLNWARRHGVELPGRKKPQPSRLSPEENRRRATVVLADLEERVPVAATARGLGISSSALYDWVQRNRDQLSKLAAELPPRPEPVTTAPSPDGAACAGSDPDAWFPPLGSDTSHLTAICAGCPVRAACLRMAMEAEGNASARLRYGIFGGLDGMERYQLSRQTEAVAA